jgi:PAS domain S-box-containing protein
MPAITTSATSDPLAKAPLTVLIVDDTPVNRTIAASALENYVKVLEAGNGRDAIELARRHRPQLLLLDVMMPDMDGFEVARRLRADPSTQDIQIIFVTAMTDDESHMRGLALGAVDFLHKPIDSGILRVRVLNALEREQLRRQSELYQSKLLDSLEQLAQNSHILEAIFDHPSEAYLVLDEQLSIIKLNQLGQDWLCPTFGPLIGQSLEVLRLSTLDGQTINSRDILKGQSIFDCYLGVSNDSPIPMTASVRQFTDQENRSFHLLGLRDISFNIQLQQQTPAAEEARKNLLRELTQQKHALDEHALVSMTDRMGNITYVNSKFCTTAGYKQEELLGQNHRIIKSSLHPPEFYADMLATIYRGETWKGEIANRAKDGSIYWVASTVVPWLDKEGFPVSFLAIRTDIMDCVLAKQQLIEAQQRQMQIAADIQNHLLFGLPPKNLRGILLACHSEGSEGIDGDFYHFQRFDDHLVDVLTGDVMGKGVAAALVAAGVKSAYEQALIKLMTERQFNGEPPPVQAIVNSMHADLMQELMHLGCFVTLTLLRVNRQDNSVTWVNAGHTPTLLGRAGTDEVLELLGENLPLGVMPEEQYAEHCTPMQDGDMLLLFSDGLSESVNQQGEQFGVDRIKNLLAMGMTRAAYPTMMLNSLRSVVHDHTDFSVTRDDSTVVVLKLTATDEIICFDNHSCDTRNGICAQKHHDLPRELNELTPLRHGIEAMCDLMAEEDTQMLVLATFEAATNIIRHTPEKLKRTHLTAVLKRCEQGVSVELIHAGQAFIPEDPATPDFSGNSFGGFGLYIIENAVDRVDYSAPMPGLGAIRMFKRYAHATHASTD